MIKNTHIFAVAVETYMDTSITAVSYAESDALAFVKAWQSLGVDSSKCTILLSNKATRTSILSHLKKFLSDIDKNDTVIFFFAGHGATYSDESYITAHDTMRGDGRDTSIRMEEIFKQLKNCRSKRVLLFLDSCHSGMPTSTGMRSITSAFSTDQMKKFCDDSEFTVGFASSKASEFSWSNPSLKHGIWTHCIIEALTGKEKSALEKGALLTGDSLRNYLSEAVPRLLRTTRSGIETQTPCAFGNSTKEFIIADLGPLIATQAKNASSQNPIVKDSIVQGEEIGSIRSLTGFKKHSHRVPDENNHATQSFVSKIGSENLKIKSSEVYKSIREEFAFKKKDINYVSDFDAYSIKTPDFDVNVRLEQCHDDPESYRILTQVTSFRRREVVFEDAFSNVFSQFCDTLVIEFSKNVNVDKIIDAIEDSSVFEESLSYEPDGSSLTLKLETPPIKLVISQYDMRITATSFGDLKQLIVNTKTALKTLSGEGIPLNLTNQ